MTVPPPYDPVLLREHAFHDTGLTSLVITPGTNDGSFHSVAEKGLGLFLYRFADHYTIDKIDNSFKAIRLLNCLLVFTLIVAIYYSIDYAFERFSGKLLESSTSMVSVQNKLLSPFSQKKSHTTEDIESSPGTSHAPLFDDFNEKHLHTPESRSVPFLSSSVTNTPTSPDVYDNFNFDRGLENSMLLNFIEADEMNKAKSHKIH